MFLPLVPTYYCSKKGFLCPVSRLITAGLLEAEKNFPSFATLFLGVGVSYILWLMSIVKGVS